MILLPPLEGLIFQASRHFDEHSSTVNSGRERGQHQQPPPSPLQPHDSTIPRFVHSADRPYHNSGQHPESSYNRDGYRQTYSSPPPPSRNRERSRSHFRHLLW